LKFPLKARNGKIIWMLNGKLNQPKFSECLIHQPFYENCAKN
jgi:hypothetical protein